ncbi:MAG TPA: DUF5723 family protein [Paludibacteraceae bacterium]|nr:DUF5723 family protein [Paludibacteraceae bacterium]HOU67912.1 DUF5723 family protein [Paludibacteraceae bacterium]HPH62711.1 DUF5723 family protein [Paludibacteraceae bacterium]HQF49814.1 DUF5723 family protein [Paludibacteraceae bacterium]
MKKRVLYILLSLLSFGATTVFGQGASTLYFMEKNPLRHNLNPAFQPYDTKFYIGMPGFSSLNFSLGNNCLAFEDVFQGKTINGKKETVSFLSKKADNGIDGFLDAMHDNLYIYSDFNLQLINFGFRIKQRSYVTFSLSTKTDVQFNIPKSLAEIIFVGNGDIDATKTYHIDDLAFNALVYSEAAVGYSYNLNDKLNLGAKLKLLLGHSSLHTDFDDLTLTMNKDQWVMSGDGRIDISTPGIKLLKDEDGSLKDIEYNEDDVKFADYAKIAGLGVGVDLGATYRLLPELQFSASVIDLGFIRWRDNLHGLKQKTDFTFNGVVYDIKDRDTVDYGKEYEEIFNNMYTVENDSDPFTSWLTAKVFLGAEYGVWDNKMSFGLLSKTYIHSALLSEELSLSANFKPWRVFSTSLSYSLLDGCWSNFGWGTNFNLGTLNLYAAIDNIPVKFAKGDNFVVPTQARDISFSMGMNFVFGWTKKPKEEKKPEEEMPVSIVEDSIPVDTIAPNTIAAIDTIPAVDTVAIDTVPVLDTIPVMDTIPTLDTIPAKDTVLAPEIPIKEPSAPKINNNEGKLWEKASYGIMFEEKQHLMILNPSSYNILDEIAEYMLAHKNARLVIKGHYSMEQGAEFSRFMSKEHASLIRGYLVEKEIERSRIEIKAVGGDEPVASEDTEAGREKNRRMEIRSFE